MNIQWEDKDANYSCVEVKLIEVQKKKTDLFLLPEMSFTGFSMNIGVTKESNKETINRMSYYVKKYHTVIGFGWVKDCGEKSENYYIKIGRAHV